MVLLFPFRSHYQESPSCTAERSEKENQDTAIFGSGEKDKKVIPDPIDDRLSDNFWTESRWNTIDRGMRFRGFQKLWLCWALIRRAVDSTPGNRRPARGSRGASNHTSVPRVSAVSYGLSFLPLKLAPRKQTSISSFLSAVTGKKITPAEWKEDRSGKNSLRREKTKFRNIRNPDWEKILRRIRDSVIIPRMEKWEREQNVSDNVPNDRTYPRFSDCWS